MEYTTLGHTKIEISKICVGCMSFGKAGTMHDWTLNAEETENVVKHALDLGINFFDTANGYSAGTSEEYLGCALKKNVREKTLSLLLRYILILEGCQKRQFIVKLTVRFND